MVSPREAAPQTSCLPDWLTRARPWLLLCVLASLHGLLWIGDDLTAARVALLSHIGLLLMWQPLVGAHSSLNTRALILLAVAVLAMVVFYGPAVLSLWMLLLAGLVGGKVFFSTSRGPRIYYLGALAYLITALFTIALPRALPPGLSLPAGIDTLGLWLSPLALSVMLAVPGHDRADRDREVLDFVSGLFVLLLLAVLALGTLAAMLIAGVDYLRALLGTLTVLAAMLMLLSWAWNPRGGFGGLGVAFTRYVLSLALPYERWLESLAALAEEDAGRRISSPVPPTACRHCRWLPAASGARAAAVVRMKVSSDGAAPSATTSSTHCSNWPSSRNGRCPAGWCGISICWCNCSASSIRPACAPRNCAA